MSTDLEGSVREPKGRLIIDFKVPAADMIRKEATSQNMSTEDYVKYCFDLARIMRKLSETGEIYVRASSGAMNRFYPFKKA